MSKRIELHVTFTAVYRDSNEFIPADEVTAHTDVEVTIPFLDSKYVVFPKILEGATDRVITEMGARVSDYYRRKAEEEKLAAEEALRPSFWGELAKEAKNGQDSADS